MSFFSVPLGTTLLEGSPVSNLFLYLTFWLSFGLFPSGSLLYAVRGVEYSHPEAMDWLHCSEQTEALECCSLSDTSMDRFFWFSGEPAVGVELHAESFLSFDFSNVVPRCKEVPEQNCNYVAILCSLDSAWLF